MTKYLASIFIILLTFQISCSSEESGEKALEKKEVDKISVVLEADSSYELSAPSWIKTDSDAFFFSDRSKISRFDIDGTHLLSFGQKGRGPGEFLSVGDFWKFDEVFMVHDNNGQKLIRYDLSGNHIKDVLLDFIDISGPAEIEALSPQQFVMASGGKNGSLLTLVDIAKESTEHFGDAVDKDVDSQQLQSSDKRHQAISSGNIPARFKNKVLLSSNRTGLFSFQQTTAVLEKYDDSGELTWRKNIKVPAIEGLFDELFEENRDRLKSGEMLLSFVYADGISANDKGVAIKLNQFEGEPVTIVWVPNDGKELTVVTFPELKKPYPVPLRFAIADDGSYILFSNTLEGKIYKADWPL